jgi:hypothetical protein
MSRSLAELTVLARPSHNIINTEVILFDFMIYVYVYTYVYVSSMPALRRKLSFAVSARRGVKR